MAFRTGDRNQGQLFPPRIEDYVRGDDPVRAYDAFVDALDLGGLGIDADPNRVGNPRYEPRTMLKILMFGYSYGIRSSRKLEREVNYNLAFIWLARGLAPDFKTISEFRRNNKGALKKVLAMCAKMCVKLDLVAGNTLFCDGSKIRANASIKNSWTAERCEKALDKVDERIEEMLSECDAADESEEGQASLVRMKEEIAKSEKYKEKVKEIAKELEESGRKSVNTVDGECERMHSIHGSHASYNAQIVVDEKHGLIVGSGVVSDNNDLGQFASQITAAEANVGKECEAACADSGYADTDDLNKIYEKGTKVVVPSQRQAADKEKKEFGKESFRYDAEKDCYICPEGNELKRFRDRPEKNASVYRISAGGICQGCRNFGRCAVQRTGREIYRLFNEEAREKLEAEYMKEDSKAIYKLRKEKAELPFGHIKHNLGVRGFLLRGLEGVRCEMSLLSVCFDIARMITIFGVKMLVCKIKAISGAVLMPVLSSG